MELIFVNGYDVVNTTFENKEHIKSVDCLYRDWSNNSMDYAFKDCINLLSVTNINQNISSMVGTFENCYNMATQPIIPDSVVNMHQTFYNCSLLLSGRISNNAQDLSQAFYNCSNITQFPNITNTVNMYQSFDGCSNIYGDIYIHSEIITNAVNCFSNTSLEKNVYIPFQNNGVNTLTYNSFINAGYKTDQRVNGVLLFDINDEGIDLSDYEYFIDSNKIAHLIKYIGSNTDVIQPKIN